MRGPVLTPHDDGYGSARQIWNAMVDRRPGAIARCTGPEDVRTAVTCAAEHEFPVSIRAGGHNIAGLALCDDGLTIDLSLMKHVNVDPGPQRRTRRPDSRGVSSIAKRSNSVSPRRAVPYRPPASRD